MSIYVHRENLKLPDRRPYDEYETPGYLCEQGVALIAGKPKRVLDPGAGSGAWGRAARARWPKAWIEGVEIQAVENPGCYNLWWKGTDYLTGWPTQPAFDAIIANPPYNLLEPFIATSLRRLAPGGQLLFMARLAFLEGQKRRDTLWRETPPKKVFVCSKRPSFQSDGRTNATSFCLILWQLGHKGETTLGWL